MAGWTLGPSSAIALDAPTQPTATANVAARMITLIIEISFIAHQEEGLWRCNREQGFVANRKGPKVQVDREESNASDDERNLSEHHLVLRNRPRINVANPKARNIRTTAG